MIGQHSRTAERARGSGQGRGSITIAPRMWRDVMDRGTWRARGRQRPTPRASAHRRRVFTLVAEHLEGRSVPSGFGLGAFSALTSAVRSTASLAQHVVSSSDLGGPAAAPSSVSTAPALPVADPIATATGAVVDAMDSGSDVLGAATASVLPPIGVSQGSQATGGAAPDADAPGASMSIDVPGLISMSAGLSPVMSDLGNIGTALVGAVDDVGQALDGLVASGSGGGNSGGDGVGISIGGDSGLGSTVISASISNAGIPLTLPGLWVDVELDLSAPDATGGSPVLSPPSAPTAPTSPGGSSGSTPVSPPSQGGNPVTNPPTGPTAPSGSTSPTSPTAPGGSAAPPASPTSGGGSTTTPEPIAGSPGSVTPPGAGLAQSTGSTSGGPAQAVGGAADAQAAVLAPSAGSAASPCAAGATANEAGSSMTGRSVTATVSGPNGGAGGVAAAGQGPLEGAQSPVDSPPGGVEPRADPSIAPADLVPGDLESLERAFAQLMHRLDGMGDGLAGWLTHIGTLEMLAAAGMVALACEVLRRWERRRQLAIPRVQVGSYGRPGPFYRPRGCPFGRLGPGRSAGRPAIV
jgi:hypothetical protein